MVRSSRGALTWATRAKPLLTSSTVLGAARGDKHGYDAIRVNDRRLVHRGLRSARLEGGQGGRDTARRLIPGFARDSRISKNVGD